VSAALPTLEASRQSHVLGISPSGADETGAA